jgi:uncharacterized delta-60 repeat protein
MFNNQNSFSKTALFVLIIGLFLAATGFGQAAGELDPAFFPGKTTTAFGSSYEYGFAAAVQTDGKLIAAGYTDLGGQSDFALARYNPDGSLDVTFDGDGKVITSFSGYATINSLAIQADGRIIAAGEAKNGSNFDFALARYNSNGSPDNTFDGDGFAFTSFGTNQTTEQTESLAIQADGKIVVGGYVYQQSTYDIALVRFNASGTLDNSFDGDGKMTTEYVTGKNDFLYALVIQTDGKIVVGGESGDGFQTTAKAAFARFNSDGSPDANFDFSALSASPENKEQAVSNLIGDGRVVIPVSGGGDRILDLAIQPNGKIVAAGFGKNGANDDFALIRLNGTALVPTAADATVSGRVLTSTGAGIRSVQVTITFPNGETRSTLSTTFGNYRFSEIPVGAAYVISVSARKYAFTQPTQIRLVQDDLQDVDFIAE